MKFLREAGYVERAHNVPHHGSYSVGIHCYHMLCMLYQLHPNPSHDLIKAILYHDAAERIVGDVPAPAKWAYREYASEYYKASEEVELQSGLYVTLEPNEQIWLKALDAVEFYLWVEDQRALGNRHIDNCYDQIITYLATVHLPKPVREFYQSYTFGRTPERIVP